MQLSALLDKLQSVFSPAFLVSGLTPIFCFILVNGAILDSYNPSVNAWVMSHFVQGTTEKTIFVGVAGIAFFVVAYIFSTFNVTLRETLEGRHLPGWIASPLKQAEQSRINKIEENLLKIRRTRRNLVNQSASWKETLQKARLAGSLKQCTYPEIPPGPNPARGQIKDLEELRWKTELIEADAIKNAVNSLGLALTNNSADIRNNEDSGRLDRDHVRLVRLIDYACERADAEYISQYNDKEFNFSRFSIAPTKVGNIAESARGYAQSRYGINLDFFWTRLQNSLQAKSDFYATLQNAKTQVDFMVSFFWLTVVSAIIWMVLPLFLSHGNLLPFFLAWLAGPLLARGWYLLALQNYRSFADLLRCSVDLYRFDLLEALKITKPDDTGAERLLWQQLNSKMCYGEEVMLPYKQT